MSKKAAKKNGVILNGKEPAKIADAPQKIGKDKEQTKASVVDPEVGEKFDMNKPVSRDLNTLQAIRRQLMVDLGAARKADDGHILAKELETQIEQVDAEIQPLREDLLRAQEKLKAKKDIGTPETKVVKPKPAPVSVDHVSEYAIHEMFKLQLRAPSSVAFDMVKVCGIFEEAAYDLYFAYNAVAPCIQKGIRDLKVLCDEICHEMKESEEKRLAIEAARPN